VPHCTQPWVTSSRSFDSMPLANRAGVTAVITIRCPQCGQGRRKVGRRDDEMFRFCMEHPHFRHIRHLAPISRPIHKSVNEYLCDAQTMCIAASNLGDGADAECHPPATWPTLFHRDRCVRAHAVEHTIRLWTRAVPAVAQSIARAPYGQPGYHRGVSTRRLACSAVNLNCSIAGQAKVARCLGLSLRRGGYGSRALPVD
jgi:hypothetical protein